MEEREKINVMEVLYTEDKVKKVRNALKERDAIEEMTGVFLINNIMKMEKKLVEILSKKKARKSAKKVVPSRKKRNKR
jgi:hypothetical protein